MLIFISIYILLAIVFFFNLYRSGNEFKRKYIWLFVLVLVAILEANIILDNIPLVDANYRKIRYVLSILSIHTICYTIVLFPTLFWKFEYRIFPNLEGRLATKALTIFSWVVLILIDIAFLVTIYFIYTN